MFDFIFGSVATLLTLAVGKAIAEPVALRLGKSFLKSYASPAYDRLDLEWLPLHYKDGLDSAKSWLLETCLPEIAYETREELTSDQMKRIANYILANFDLQASLRKQQTQEE